MPSTKPLLIITGTRREASLVTAPGTIVIAGGGDPARVIAELDRLAPQCCGVLSFGTGGALERGLRIGRIVIGTRVTGGVTGGGDADCDPAWIKSLQRKLPGARLGPIFADGRLLATRREKWQAGTVSAAIVADMESHLAAAAAARHSLPLAVLRCISDTSNSALPHAVTVAMKPNGSLALAAITGSILRHPLQLPALATTGLRFSRCFRALKLATRQAGPRLGFDKR